MCPTFFSLQLRNPFVIDLIFASRVAKGHATAGTEIQPNDSILKTLQLRPKSLKKPQNGNAEYQEGCP
jgi:hypothetical protein